MAQESVHAPTQRRTPTSAHQPRGVVLLESDSVWIFTRDEARQLAQQNARGMRQLYWYSEPRPARAGSPAPLNAGDMKPYLLEHRAADLFAADIDASAGGDL